MNERESFRPYELLDDDERFRIKHQVEEAINQFDDPVVNKWVTGHLQDSKQLEQGAILENVPMYFFDREQGSLRLKRTNAIILSNSCDVMRRENIILAPLFSFDDSGQNENTIVNYKKNSKFSILYFPDVNIQNYYINFDFIYNLNLEYLNTLLAEGKVKKLYELTNNGYYLFITKLTIFFARPESVDVSRGITS